MLGAEEETQAVGLKDRKTRTEALKDCGNIAFSVRTEYTEKYRLRKITAEDYCGKTM